MKHRILIYTMLTILVMFACSSNNAKKYNQEKISATEYNFSRFNGKIVKNVEYCDGCSSSGDILMFTFTDGTNFKIYAYKYDMKVYLE